MQTHIGVQLVDRDHYEVTATEGLLTTRHQVDVSTATLKGLGLADIEPTEVLRETFVMLLEREPATSVPAKITLEGIGNCYPGFWSELGHRVRSASSMCS